MTWATKSSNLLMMRRKRVSLSRRAASIRLASLMSWICDTNRNGFPASLCDRDTLEQDPDDLPVLAKVAFLHAVSGKVPGQH